MRDLDVLTCEVTYPELVEQFWPVVFPAATYDFRLDRRQLDLSPCYQYLIAVPWLLVAYKQARIQL